MSTAIVPVPGDLERVIALAVTAVPAEESQRAYRRWISDYLVFCRLHGTPITKESVYAYLSSLKERNLSAASRNLAISAIKRLAAEASDNLLLDAQIANGISRVKGAPRHGRRLGRWLSPAETQELILTPGIEKLQGIRDRALIAVLAGCALRRGEVAALTVDHLQPVEGRWVFVDLLGKGGRIRSVPVPDFAYAALERWMEAAEITHGRIFRKISRYGRVGKSLDGTAVWRIVKKHTGGKLAPHDLRRTFAKMADEAGGELHQIQATLGHSSVQVTERYLGRSQNLKHAPCDTLPRFEI